MGGYSFALGDLVDFRVSAELVPLFLVGGIGVGADSLVFLVPTFPLYLGTGAAGTYIKWGGYGVIGLGPRTRGAFGEVRPGLYQYSLASPGFGLTWDFVVGYRF